MKSVLLIEDDIWLGESFERVLGTEFKVQRVESLEEAAEATNQNVPDIIVADFMFEGRNTLALLHELSSYEDTMHVPVILCSTIGEDLQKFEDQLSHYGVVRVCDKADLTPGSLRRVVRVSLAAKAAS
jgi:DNA-binding response OmpR family regulator